MLIPVHAGRLSKDNPGRFPRGAWSSPTVSGWSDVSCLGSLTCFSSPPSSTSFLLTSLESAGSNSMRSSTRLALFTSSLCFWFISPNRFLFSTYNLYNPALATPLLWSLCNPILCELHFLWIVPLKDETLTLALCYLFIWTCPDQPSNAWWIEAG